MVAGSLEASMLIAASESLSGSAIALVEPWACVEDAYACHERTTLKAGAKLAADAPVPEWARVRPLVSITRTEEEGRTLLRFEGPLYFASAGHLESRVLENVASKPGLKFVVLDAGGINEVDATGIDILRQNNNATVIREKKIFG